MTQTEKSDWKRYSLAGQKRALNLGNRGPMRFDNKGRLDQGILDAYFRTGFYVFTEVISEDEVAELKNEFDQVLDNAPVSDDDAVDTNGRPVKFNGYYSLSKNESSDLHAIPRNAVGLVSHPLMMMDSALRTYGHPQILRMVESVNGPDFIPFHEAVFHKAAGEGAPTRWHQDGRTHWTKEGKSLEQPDGSGKTHGFNLSVSWSHGTPENCLWVVPGSHRQWRLADGGEFPSITEWLPEAVTMMLAPGDCGMVNRRTLHGSYPNRSPGTRITMVIGFHKRDSAIGAETTNVHAFKRPGEIKEITYSEDYVLHRARMIPIAIDARRQYYSDEIPYEYQGSYLGTGIWNEQVRSEISEPGNEYWQRDITL